MVYREPAKSPDNIASLDRAYEFASRLKYAYLLIGATCILESVLHQLDRGVEAQRRSTCNGSSRVIGQNSPYRCFMALQHGGVPPLAHLPHAGIGVPASADYQLAVLADIKSADVGAVAKQECIGVVVERLAGLAHVDDLVLATRDDETLGEVVRRRHNGQRVDKLFTLDLDGAVVGGWLLGLELP